MSEVHHRIVWFEDNPDVPEIMQVGGKTRNNEFFEKNYSRRPTQNRRATEDEEYLIARGTFDPSKVAN